MGGQSLCDVKIAALINRGSPVSAHRITAHRVVFQIAIALWFATHGARAALVRPDHYVYGVASTPEEIQSLAASYQAACTA